MIDEATKEPIIIEELGGEKSGRIEDVWGLTRRSLLSICPSEIGTVEPFVFGILLFQTRTLC